MLPIASSESRNVKVKDSDKDRDRDSQRRGKEDSLNSTSSNNTGEIQLESFKEGEEKGMKKEDGSELIGSTEAFSQSQQPPNLNHLQVQLLQSNSKLGFPI